jgi:hypothetical protein
LTFKPKLGIPSEGHDPGRVADEVEIALQVARRVLVVDLNN